MVDIAKVCLGLNSLLYLIYSYKFIFDLKATFAGYDLTPADFGNAWPTLVSITRMLGVCYFVMAFLMGHTIKIKPSAGIRTALMLNGLFMVLLVYRKFIEDPNSPDVNARSLASTDKNMKIIGFAFVLSIIGMATVVDPPQAKKA